MSRREDFRRTLRHEQPENLIVDFGGNPLSSMEGRSMRTLLDFLGYAPPPDAERILFGRVARLDDRLLTHFDIDTRSVGTILRPQESQFRMISDDEYIDEWGIRRRYTGMYWDIVSSPLRGATVDDL
ncbi:MAG: methyltransferase, partial [Actinomycetia bacterium]|nr:methyltransferase [Actinomycetes bacterium]